MSRRGLDFRESAISLRLARGGGGCGSTALGCEGFDEVGRDVVERNDFALATGRFGAHNDDNFRCRSAVHDFAESGLLLVAQVLR